MNDSISNVTLYYDSIKTTTIQKYPGLKIRTLYKRMMNEQKNIRNRNTEGFFIIWIWIVENCDNNFKWMSDSFYFILLLWLLLLFFFFISFSYTNKFLFWVFWGGYCRPQFYCCNKNIKTIVSVAGQHQHFQPNTATVTIATTITTTIADSWLTQVSFSNDGEERRMIIKI